MMYDIKGFLETSFIDWPGKLCSVLFLPYCNLRCRYCHNPALVLCPEQLPSFPFQRILDRLVSLRDWVDGVCLTGGEPTLHSNLPSLIREIKGLGFLVKLDTNGSRPRMLERLIEKGEVDFISMDVKAPMDLSHYTLVTGARVRLDLIRASIGILRRGRVPYEFRMTAVPGLHSFDDIRRLGRELRPGPRFILQNFNPANPLDPSLRETRPYDLGHLKEIEREVRGMA